MTRPTPIQPDGTAMVVLGMPILRMVARGWVHIAIRGQRPFIYLASDTRGQIGYSGARP
jgi:hypothetical protein